MSADTPIDTAARARALDTRLSVALQAPAGSGKTTILTQRFLALLAIVDEPESILAVTFTRKAAAQMRARLLEALQNASNGRVVPKDAAQAQTLELARAALEHGRSLGWSLVESPSRLRIMTIDGLNRSIAAALPLLSDGAGVFDIAEQPQQLYRDVARRTLEDAESDASMQAIADHVFGRLDNQWDKLEALLARMLARRTHWLRHLSGKKPGELHEHIETTLVRLADEALRALHSRLPDAWLDEGVRLARLAVAELQQSAGDPELQRQLEGVASGRPASRSDWDNVLEWWRGLSHLALTRDRTVRKSVSVRMGFPVKQPAQRAAKEAMEAWLETLQRDPTATSLLAEMRELPSPLLSRQDSEALDALIRLLHYAAAELLVHSQETGKVDYVSISSAARAALSDPDLGSDRLIHQGARLEHVLIDEFQDTSIEQFELLAALTADWAVGDGRTVFLVGDPMQSIYQFREAEVGLFAQARDRGIGRMQFESLALQCNFRSQTPLVEFCNDVFSKVFPAEELPREAGVPYLASKAAASRASNLPVGVRLRGLEASGEARVDRRREALAVLQIVEEARSVDAEASVAILVSARSHAKVLVQTLRDAGVAVQGVDLVPLADRPVVQDLLALTRAVHSLSDRVAWLAILRAPWCGLSLAELSLAIEGSANRTVLEVLLDHNRQPGWPEAMRVRITRLLEVMNVVRSLTHQPLASRVERAWWQLGGPSAYADAQALDDARCYLDTLATTELELESLDTLLADLFAASDPDPTAVQVMTIHRAKGLEFDVVIMPGLERLSRRDDPELLDWVSWSEQDGRDVMLVAPIRAPESEEPSALGRWIRRLRTRRANRERARLMYVGATRARSSLHLLATLRRSGGKTVPPGPSSPLGILWPAVSTGFERLEQQVDTPQPSSGQGGLMRLPTDWLPPSCPEDVRFEALALTSGELTVDTTAADRFRVTSRSMRDDTARLVGIVLHRELERLAHLPQLPALSELAQSKERWRAMLRAEGVPGIKLDWALERISEGITRTLEDSRGRWILSRRAADDGIEWPLTGRHEGRWISIVIDRAFVDDTGQRWIVDYKSATPEEGVSLDTFLMDQREQYSPQLRRYADFVARLEGRSVRAALYFPLLAQFVEVELTSSR